VAQRKAHVYRVYQTDDRGNITDTDVWVDVMRIDQLMLSEQRGVPTGATHQDRIYAVLWGDDTRHGGPNGSQARVVEPLTVTQPNPEDPTDPSLPSVIIPLIQRAFLSLRGGASGATSQSVQWVFQNFADKAPKQLASATGRHGKILRITNNDLNNEISFPVVNVGDPQPPTPLGKQVSWDAYSKALQDGTIDDSQYVDFATIDRFMTRFPPSPFDRPQAGVLQGQIVTYAMINKQQGNGPPGVEDLFKNPPSGSASTPYLTDPFQCIVNVSWGGLQFLYSGADGMFGSNDGVNWTATGSSVPAIGLAWIDNVWVAIGGDGSSWTSSDGAQTWQEGLGILNVQQVAAMRPAGVDDQGNKPQGVFAAWGYDAEFNNAIVYISNDLGQSWDVAMIISLTVGVDGYEVPQALSGCGGAFFFTTNWGNDRFSDGNGKLYVSTGGGEFDGGAIVFGPSTDWQPDDPPPTFNKAFTALGTAYDQSTGTYILLGLAYRTQLGSGRTNNAVYAASSAPVFGQSEGTPFYETKDAVHPDLSGIFISSYNGAAAGAGFCATVLPLVNFPSGTPTDTDFIAAYTTGDTTGLFTAGSPSASYAISSVCFKSKNFKPGEAIITPPADPTTTDSTAMFALVAYAVDSTSGADLGGGVFTATPGGSFTQTHEGTPLATPSSPGNFTAGGAVATGRVNLSAAPPT
jgi:hypothetical protein